MPVVCPVDDEVWAALDKLADCAHSYEARHDCYVYFAHAKADGEPCDIYNRMDCDIDHVEEMEEQR